VAGDTDDEDEFGLEEGVHHQQSVDKITDLELNTWILRGLPSEYSAEKTAAKLNPTLMSDTTKLLVFLTGREGDIKLDTLRAGGASVFNMGGGGGGGNRGGRRDGRDRGTSHALGSGCGNVRCYKCGELGHIRRDCPRNKGRGRGRGRYAQHNRPPYKSAYPQQHQNQFNNNHKRGRSPDPRSHSKRVRFGDDQGRSQQVHGMSIQSDYDSDVPTNSDHIKPTACNNRAQQSKSCMKATVKCMTI
jgi:Zinc knuckle